MFRKQVGQQDDDRGTHQGPPEALAAPQHYAQQKGDHLLVAEALGLQVAQVQGVEAAGQTAQARSQGEGCDLVAVGAHAHGIRGDGAVPEGFEGAAPLGGQQVAHEHPDQGQETQAEPVELRLAEDMPEDGRLGDAEALGAPREALQLVEGRGAEGREAEGGQGELGAFQAQGGQGQQATQHQAEGRGGEEGWAHAHAQSRDHQARGVAAQAQEGDLGQVHLAQVAHGHVQADEQDAVDGEQGQQAQGIFIQHQQRNGAEDSEGQEFGTPEEEETSHGQTFLMVALPNTPVGRRARARISRMRPGASRQPLPT